MSMGISYAFQNSSFAAKSRIMRKMRIAGANRVEWSITNAIYFIRIVSCLVFCSRTWDRVFNGVGRNINDLGIIESGGIDILRISGWCLRTKVNTIGKVYAARIDHWNGSPINIIGLRPSPKCQEWKSESKIDWFHGDCSLSQNSKQKAFNTIGQMHHM